MKKMRKALRSVLPLICVAMLCACGGSDDNGGDNGKTNDNGTGIENNGGNGKTALSPDDEKSFLEETSRVFMSYFNANEFEDMSNAAKQIGDLEDDDVNDWVDDIMEKTLTASGTIIIGGPVFHMNITMHSSRPPTSRARMRLLIRVANGSAPRQRET